MKVPQSTNQWGKWAQTHGRYGEKDFTVLFLQGAAGWCKLGVLEAGGSGQAPPSPLLCKNGPPLCPHHGGSVRGGW